MNVGRFVRHRRARGVLGITLCNRSTEIEKLPFYLYRRINSSTWFKDPRVFTHKKDTVQVDMDACTFIRSPRPQLGVPMLRSSSGAPETYENVRALQGCAPNQIFQAMQVVGPRPAQALCPLSPGSRPYQCDTVGVITHVSYIKVTSVLSTLRRPTNTRPADPPFQFWSPEPVDSFVVSELRLTANPAARHFPTAESHRSHFQRQAAALTCLAPHQSTSRDLGIPETRGSSCRAVRPRSSWSQPVDISIRGPLPPNHGFLNKPQSIRLLLKVHVGGSPSHFASNTPVILKTNGQLSWPCSWRVGSHQRRRSTLDQWTDHVSETSQVPHRPSWLKLCSTLFFGWATTGFLSFFEKIQELRKSLLLLAKLDAPVVWRWSTGSNGLTKYHNEGKPCLARGEGDWLFVKGHPLTSPTGKTEHDDGFAAPFSLPQPTLQRTTTPDRVADRPSKIWSIARSSLVVLQLMPRKLSTVALSISLQGKSKFLFFLGNLWAKGMRHRRTFDMFQWWFLLGNHNHQANPHVHQQHIIAKTI